MTLYLFRSEDTPDYEDLEVEYEVEVDYTPGRPPPSYRERGDARFCDPGEPAEMEVLSVMRREADGSLTDMGRDYFDGNQAARDDLMELARDAAADDDYYDERED